jgi:hypothetical protein
MRRRIHRLARAYEEGINLTSMNSSASKTRKKNQQLEKSAQSEALKKARVLDIDGAAA